MTYAYPFSQQFKETQISFEAAKFRNAPQETAKALAEYYDKQSQLAADLLEKATDLIGLELIREQFALNNISNSS